MERVEKDEGLPTPFVSWKCPNRGIITNPEGICMDHPNWRLRHG